MQTKWRKRVLAGGLIVSGTMGAALVVLFAYVAWPATLYGEVLNSTDRVVQEVVFRAGDAEARLGAVGPGESRGFSFTTGHEGSLIVQARLGVAVTASGDCATYINWAVRRAEYRVELVGGESLQVRCLERRQELKF